MPPTPDFPDLDSLAIVPTPHLFRLDYGILQGKELLLCPNLALVLKKNPKSKWEELFIGTTIVVRDKKPGAKSFFHSRVRTRPEGEAVVEGRAKFDDIGDDDDQSDAVPIG